MRFILTILVLLFCGSIDAAQVVLVTGASRGIGFAIAKRLSREGYIVYAGKRTTSTLEFLSPLQEQYPDHLFMVDLDVTNQESIDKAVRMIVEKEGRIDVLVNNAGIVIRGSVENVSIDEAQKVFDMNFFGPMRMCQAVLPIMRSQMSGRIIQISSRSGFRPFPSISIYAASKFALEGLSETMAATLKPWNILVSMIEPGPVRTDVLTSPYGSQLPREIDPYAPIFERSRHLNPTTSLVQEPDEIACIVQEAMEAKCPLFRYQTTDEIKDQAALRWIDITGVSHVEEWNSVLGLPKKDLNE